MTTDLIKLDDFQISTEVVKSFQSEDKFIEYAKDISYFDLPIEQKVVKLKAIYKIANPIKEQKEPTTKK